MIKTTDRLKVHSITERSKKARMRRFGHVKRREQQYVGRQHWAWYHLGEEFKKKEE